MQTIETDTRIIRATVYLDRALITRQCQQELAPGHYLIKLNNLPDSLPEDSFRVSARGSAKAIIADVQLKNDFFEKIPHEQLEQLNRELLQLNDEQAMIDKKLETLLHQKEFVTSIKVFSAESISKDLPHHRPKVSDWQETVQFLGANLSVLNSEILQLNKSKATLKLQIQQLQARINELSAAKSYRRKYGAVQIEVQQAGTLSLEASYLSNYASWYPLYDARVDSENKTLDLRYYGIVKQQTAEDWNEVEIELSTAKPQESGNPPQLYAWILDEYMSMAAPAPKMMQPQRRTRSMEMEKVQPGAMAEDEEETSYQAATVSPAGYGTSVVFKANGYNSIPGNGDPTRVLIVQQQYQANFRYFAVPKLSVYAYLTADVKNNSDFPLLPGKVNIFMDNNFIGSSQFREIITPDEQFELSLGIDEGIKITHKLLKQHSNESGLFSKDRNQEYSYLISLKNKRKSAEEITVWDQLPVAQNDKIKVQIKRLEPAENPGKDIRKLPVGTIEWKFTLPAGEEKDLYLHFVVQYPVNFQISGL